MPTMLWIWGFLALFAHSVVSYTNGKCGPPTRYPDKHLLEKYEVRQEFNDGDHVTYKCALGYTGQGLRVSYCNNGAWSRLNFQCKTHCGNHGNRSLFLMIVPLVTMLKEKLPEMGKGAVRLESYQTAESDTWETNWRTWSTQSAVTGMADVATVTFATRVVCPLLKNENATFHGAKAAYNPGETLSYSCNAGFQLNGNNSILQCGRTGQWIPSHTNCHMIPVQVTCPPPAVPNSSGQDGYKAEYEVGERAAISCQKGYRLIGSSEIKCLEDGQWEELPNCRLVEGRCPPPPYVPNAHTEHNDQTHYKPNTTLRLKCNHGYRMARGPSTISCRDGQWTDVQLMCESTNWSERPNPVP
ncbi:sushi, von Willebrand factor type A, EGF and pentraxin domain-containing protein 1 isoform X3 [Silurus asotus]|uniref:Sushi, von Willebrand factor type A, EGF and pentraxin domain-containing protein 1 isoform X3 n=1 Tax=Silurus asotus TaxID=30991 RepID=A0AAD5FB92_SILAS|nr:sushi, von Willebrand factor type A, EGF and pentraxin domain-containing protein 1 isoform X3 [Silurus asotus]